MFVCAFRMQTQKIKKTLYQERCLDVRTEADLPEKEKVNRAMPQCKVKFPNVKLTLICLVRIHNPRKVRINHLTLVIQIFNIHILSGREDMFRFYILVAYLLSIFLYPLFYGFVIHFKVELYAYGCSNSKSLWIKF